MGCNVGDSIRAGEIESYTSFIDRDDFSNIKDYELSLDDIKQLYKELENKMSKFDSIHVSEFDIRQPTYKTPIKSVLSVLIERRAYYDYVHPDTQIARIATIIQNLVILKYGNMKYINFLTKRLRSNMTKISKGYLKPYFAGYCIQDIECICYDDLDEIEKYINSNLDIINSEMESCIVKNVSLSSEPIMPSDCNMMIGIIKRNKFKDLVTRFQEWYIEDKDGKIEILEQDIRASIHLMLEKKKISRDSITFKIAQKNDEWVVGFYSNIGISTYLILKKLYPKIKNFSIFNALK